MRTSHVVGFRILLAFVVLGLAACGDDDGGQNNLNNQTNQNNQSNQNNQADGGVEDCADQQDNDGDGLVDCNDGDCDDDPGCEGQQETDCDDDLDNDSDGLTDCADPNCDGVGSCQYPEATCDDDLDNDGDGDTDCDDADCAGALACDIRETICDDGVDNDSDGDTDCADPDCGGSVRCEYPEATCHDERDNDGDGLVDCADADCDGVGICEAAEATCDDNLDNDADGDIDCADADCDGVGICEAAETTCDDSLDNDADGDTDCDDASCQGQRCGDHGLQCQGGLCACPAGEATELSCGDSGDNDCDGLSDCDDADCFGTTPCSVETNCTDGQDNDSDTLVDCADPDCQGVGACEQPEATCDDSFDNDGDGDTDCADADCSADALCEATEATCDDSFDNDGDGDTDCADDHCDGRDCGPHGLWCDGGQCVCQHGGGTELACGDGVDDDCDGDTDCADSQCASLPFCTRSGETCALAVPLPGGGIYLGTTAGMADDLDPGATGCTGQTAAGPDHVYSIDLQAGQRLTVDLTATGGWDASLYVTTGCDSLLTDCVVGADGGGQESLTFRVDLTDTYYIVVDGRTGADAGEYTLGVSITEVGDTCTDAPVITRSTSVLSTTSGMTHDYDPGPGGCAGSAQPGADRVYAIPLTYGYKLTATLAPQGWDGSLYLLTDCGDPAGACLAGSDNAGDGTQEVVEHTCDTANQLVYLVVDAGGAAAGGVFQLDLQVALAGNEDCSLPVLLPSGPATYEGDLSSMANDYDPASGTSCILGAAPGKDAVFRASLNPGETLTATLQPAGSPAWDGVLYVMTDDCADPSACAAGSDTGLVGSPESLSYTAVSGAEEVYLVVDAASGGDEYTLDTNIGVHADTCNDAVQLSSGGTFSGTTAGKSDALDALEACGVTSAGTPGPDAWYAMDVSAGEWLEVRVQPSGWDAALVLSGPDCSISNHCLAGVDAHSDGTAEALFYRAATTGTVYITVDSAQAGVGGAFSLTVERRSPILLITEVLHHSATAADDQYEWVELYNDEDIAVDLSSFSLGFGGPNYTAGLHDLTGMIPPGACAVIGGDLSAAGNGNPSYLMAINLGGTSYDLEDAEGGVGDGVALFDRPASEVTAITAPLSAVVYGANNDNNLFDNQGTPSVVDVAAAGAGQSIERDLTNNQWSVNPTPSPGICQN